MYIVNMIVETESTKRLPVENYIGYNTTSVDIFNLTIIVRHVFNHNYTKIDFNFLLMSNIIPFIR
jgi:hypothetical protein